MSKQGKEAAPAAPVDPVAALERVRLKDASLPWLAQRPLRQLTGISVRSVALPSNGSGPPDLFLRLLPPPTTSQAQLALDVADGAVRAQLAAQAAGPSSLPSPLYESEVLERTLNPTWMLPSWSHDVKLPPAARALRSVIVSLHRALPHGQPSECLWERHVHLDSLVHLVTELAAPSMLPTDTLLFHFQDGTCLSSDALVPLAEAGLLVPTSQLTGGRGPAAAPAAAAGGGPAAAPATAATAAAGACAATSAGPSANSPADASATAMAASPSAAHPTRSIERLEAFATEARRLDAQLMAADRASEDVRARLATRLERRARALEWRSKRAAAAKAQSELRGALAAAREALERTRAEVEGQAQALRSGAAEVAALEGWQREAALRPSPADGLRAVVARLAEVQLREGWRRRMLLQGAATIFPLEAWLDAMTSAGAHSVGADDEEVAATLGYAAQLVAAAARHLGVRLKHAVRPVGSRSLMHEAPAEAPAKPGAAAGGGAGSSPAGAAAAGSGAAGAAAAGGGGTQVRVWPLYGKGVESGRLAHALRLLMQDVHQLLDALGVQWRDNPSSSSSSSSSAAAAAAAAASPPPSGAAAAAASPSPGGGAALSPSQVLQTMLLPALRLLLHAMHQAEPLPPPEALAASIEAQLAAAAAARGASTPTKDAKNAKDAKEEPAPKAAGNGVAAVAAHAAQPNGAPAAALEAGGFDALEAGVAALSEMGFPRDAAAAAMELADMDVQLAASYLAEGVAQPPPPQPQPPQPPSRHPPPAETVSLAPAGSVVQAVLPSMIESPD